MESTSGNNITLKVLNAYDIYLKDMAPTKWYVQDILHEGACLFTGAPKVGKSFFALQIAIAIAGAAETVCGDLEVGQHGRVLYLALDDTSEKRIHHRLHGFTEDEGALRNIDIVCQRDLPPLAQGLYDAIDDLLQKTNYVLVILDTLGAVSASTGGKNVYDVEYKEAVSLSALANKHGLCLIIVHHTNKGDGRDQVARAGGSHGRTGGVDSLLELSSPEKGQAILEAKPRDGEQAKLYMGRDETGGWRVTEWQMGSPIPLMEPALNVEREEVKDALTDGPKSVSVLATELGLKPDTCRKRLQRMEVDEQVRKLQDGRYLLRLVRYQRSAIPRCAGRVRVWIPKLRRMPGNFARTTRLWQERRS